MLFNHKTIVAIITMSAADLWSLRYCRSINRPFCSSLVLGIFILELLWKFVVSSYIFILAVAALCLKVSIWGMSIRFLSGKCLARSQVLGWSHLWKNLRKVTGKSFLNQYDTSTYPISWNSLTYYQFRLRQTDFSSSSHIFLSRVCKWMWFVFF